MLTHRERILKTLRGETTDRIPRGEFFVADEFVRAFLSLDAPVGAGIDLLPQQSIAHDHRAAVVEQLDLDIASVAFSEGWGALEQPDEDRAIEAVARWRAESDRFVFALIDGPFSAAAKACGFDTLMLYPRAAPDAARDLFRHGADSARTIAQAARDAGADGVILGEDIAYGRTTYISPSDLRDLYFPELGRAAREIRALGLAVFFHSDGNLNGVLDDLAACELDGIQGMEPASGMSMSSVRARIGEKVALWGNVSFEFLSVMRTDEEIAQQVRGLTSTRKLILGSCGGLVGGMNIETVRRVFGRGIDWTPR